MHYVVAFKKMTGAIRKLEINRSENLAKASIGQYLWLKESELAQPICGLITEIKSDRVVILIDLKNHSQLLQWGVGEKLHSVSAPLGDTYCFPKNKQVVCIAEGESALFIYPFIKALYNNGNSLITLFSNVDHHFLFTEEIQKMSVAFYSLAINRNSLLHNSITPYLNEILKEVQVSELFSIGHSTFVREVLNYTAHKPEINANIVLNTLVDFTGCLRNLYKVTQSRKSKFIMVDGVNFRSVYQNFDQFIHRFPTVEQKTAKEEIHSEKMVFHK